MPNCFEIFVNGHRSEKNESFLAEEYDHGDDGEREKEIEKMTENLMVNPIHIVTKTVNENE